MQMIKRITVVAIIYLVSVLVVTAQRTAYAPRYSDLIPTPPPMQFIDRILRPCAAGATPFVSAVASATGDLTLTTCVGGSVTINGVPVVPGGGLSCPGCTAGLVPYFDGANLANSPISRVSATEVQIFSTGVGGASFNNGTGAITLNASGLSRLGDIGTVTNGNQIVINNSANTLALFNDLASGTPQTIVFNGVTDAVTITAPDLEVSSTAIRPSATGITDLGTTAQGFKQAFFDSTITAAGVTGNQTIDKSAGSVNFAAAASSLVVTSNKVSVNSIVICTVATNDATLKNVQCVPAAGAFTMFGNAAATAETRVNFWVLNQ